MHTPTRTRQVGPFVAHFHHQQEFDEIYREVFEGEEYAFTAATDRPRILDAGSHIGLSVLYFKLRYPRARIVAFEPNPANFALLETNVTANRLEDVETVHAALADRDGSIDLYGDFDDPEAKTWGNTLIPNMWDPGKYDRKITVPAVRLSRYLDTPTDLVKLDIEGAEQMVIEEIASRLDAVGTLQLEFHATEASSERNDLDTVVRLLRDGSLEVEVEDKGLAGHYLVRAHRGQGASEP